MSAGAHWIETSAPGTVVFGSAVIAAPFRSAPPDATVTVPPAASTPLVPLAHSISVDGASLPQPTAAHATTTNSRVPIMWAAAYTQVHGNHRGIDAAGRSRHALTRSRQNTVKNSRRCDRSVVSIYVVQG